MTMGQGRPTSDNVLRDLIKDANDYVAATEELLWLVVDRTMECYFALSRRNQTEARDFVKQVLKRLRGIAEAKYAPLTKIAHAMDKEGKPKSADEKTASI